MGCTSSVPNIPDHSNPTENDNTEGNDIQNDVKKMDTNEPTDPETESTNVECNENKISSILPCDSLEQNLQLDRKLNSSPEHVSEERDGQITLGLMKILQQMKNVSLTLEINRRVLITDNTEVNLMENDKEIPSIELEEPHTLLTFEEVVDQVVLDRILDDISNMPGLKDDIQEDDKTTDESVIQDNTNYIKDGDNSNELELEAIIDDEDNPDEAASPSQSECSRATRWEALADIAAELPPSLAVDPLTGQIFSLTK